MIQLNKVPKIPKTQQRTELKTQYLTYNSLD